MRRYENDSNLLQHYDEIIKDKLVQGVIERAEGEKGNGKHYILRHTVITLEKSTMISQQKQC